jgi:hypothetical protein
VIQRLFSARISAVAAQEKNFVSNHPIAGSQMENWQ